MIDLFTMSKILFGNHCTQNHKLHTCVSQGHDSDAHEYRISPASQNKIREFDVILVVDADVLPKLSASLIISNYSCFV